MLIGWARIAATAVSAGMTQCTKIRLGYATAIFFLLCQLFWEFMGFDSVQDGALAGNEIHYLTLIRAGLLLRIVTQY